MVPLRQSGDSTSLRPRSREILQPAMLPQGAVDLRLTAGSDAFSPSLGGIVERDRPHVRSQVHSYGDTTSTCVYHGSSGIRQYPTFFQEEGRRVEQACVGSLPWQAAFGPFLLSQYSICGACQKTGPSSPCVGGERFLSQSVVLAGGVWREILLRFGESWLGREHFTSDPKHENTIACTRELCTLDISVCSYVGGVRSSFVPGNPCPDM